MPFDYNEKYREMKEFSQKLYGLLATTRPFFVSDPLYQMKQIRSKYGSVDNILEEIETTRSELQRVIDDLKNHQNEIPAEEYYHMEAGIDDAERVIAMVEKEITQDRVELLKVFEEHYPEFEKLDEAGLYNKIPEMVYYNPENIHNLSGIEKLLAEYYEIDSAAKEISDFISSYYMDTENSIDENPEYQELFERAKEIFMDKIRINHPHISQFISKPITSELYWATIVDSDYEENLDDYSDESDNDKYCIEKSREMEEKLKKLKEKYKVAIENNEKYLEDAKALVENIDKYRDETIQELDPMVLSIAESLISELDKHFADYIKQQFDTLYEYSRSNNPIIQALVKEALGKIYALTGIKIDPQTFEISGIPNKHEVKNNTVALLHGHLSSDLMSYINSNIFDIKRNIEIFMKTRDKLEDILKSIDNSIYEIAIVANNPNATCKDYYEANNKIMNYLSPYMR